MSTPPSPAAFRIFDWRILPLLAVTAIVMAVLVHRIAGADAFLDTLLNADGWLVASTLPIAGLNLLLSAARWRVVVEAMGYRLGFVRTVGVVLATWPLAVITPSRASDVVRAVLVRDVVPPWAGAGSVMAEKLADIQSLCLLAIAGASYFQLWSLVAGFVGLLLAEWAGIVVLVRFAPEVKKVRPLRKHAARIDNLLLAFEALRRSKSHLARLIGLSLVAMGDTILIAYALLRAMGVDVRLDQVAALWPVASFVGMLPLTVSGLGTRDATFHYLLQLTSETPHPEAPVLAATFLYVLIASWVLAIVGVPFMVRAAMTLRRSTVSAPPPDDPSSSPANGAD